MLINICPILNFCQIIRLLVKSAYQKIFFSYFSTKTYIVGTLKNRLIERVLLSTQNMLQLEGKKIFAIYAQRFCLSKPMNNISKNMHQMTKSDGIFRWIFCRCFKVEVPQITKDLEWVLKRTCLAERFCKKFM